MSIIKKIFFNKERDEKVDLSDILFDAMPKHVACIMDGNGRWAKEKGLLRAAGHREGVERVKDIVRMSSDLKIKVLTLYAFSTENWKRPKAEVGLLMNLLIEYLRGEINELHKNNVKLLTIGDISKLPKQAILEIEESKKKTENNDGMILNIALNYGSRSEIVNAVKNIVSDVNNGLIKKDNIDEETISSYLDTKGQPDPDLLIRTSGEQRISNFLLYQLAYSEFVFLDLFWPDFTCSEYKKALLIYQNRKRRFGGI